MSKGDVTVGFQKRQTTAVAFPNGQATSGFESVTFPCFTIERIRRNTGTAIKEWTIESGVMSRARTTSSRPDRDVR